MQVPDWLQVTLQISDMIIKKKSEQLTKELIKISSQCNLRHTINQICLSEQ